MKWILAFALTLSSSSVSAQDVCAAILSAKLVADDGTYLGTIENSYSANSVLNEYGSYGSEYSGTSIWNEYGNYGGKYSKQSPFNEYSSTPPMIIKGGKIIGYLSANRSMSGALNPYVLKSCDF